MPHKFPNSHPVPSPWIHPIMSQSSYSLKALIAEKAPVASVLCLLVLSCLLKLCIRLILVQLDIPLNIWNQVSGHQPQFQSSFLQSKQPPGPPTLSCIKSFSAFSLSGFIPACYHLSHKIKMQCLVPNNTLNVVWQEQSIVGLFASLLPEPYFLFKGSWQWP